MRYNVRYEAGVPVGFMEYPHENQTMTEVTKEEYVRLFEESTGLSEPIVEPEPTEQEDTDAMLIDHEYRLTLLELGVTDDAV